MAVEFSTFIGVGDCWCFGSIRAVRMGTSSCALAYVARISASAAETMTFLRIFVMMCMVLLRLKFAGARVFYERKNSPPTWLHDLISERYDTSPWMRGIIIFLW